MPAPGLVRFFACTPDRTVSLAAARRPDLRRPVGVPTSKMTTALAAHKREQIRLREARELRSVKPRSFPASREKVIPLVKIAKSCIWRRRRSAPGAVPDPLRRRSRGGDQFPEGLALLSPAVRVWRAITTSRSSTDGAARSAYGLPALVEAVRPALLTGLTSPDVRHPRSSWPSRPSRSSRHRDD